MINILSSVKENERELEFKPCCRNCANNEGDFFCYTYGLFSTPESLNNYCLDWEQANDEE